MFDLDRFDPGDADPVKLVKGIIIFLVVGVIIWKLLHL